jgi:hypothetical protein
MSLSLYQVVVVAVLIAGPLLSIRAVRSGAKDDLARPFRFLNLGFWGAVLSFALAMGAGALFERRGATGLLPLFITNSLLLVFYAFACAYWTSLGVLAHRTGRSWVVWVVAGLATLALGFVATYIVIGNDVRSKLSKPA